ncbi:HNH endonuclease [compost metagenome]
MLLRSNGFCEYCGMPGFIKLNGNTYLETHHIVPLAENGHDHPSNMIALCPNDHREAHYGKNQAELRQLFLAVVQLLP